jgi:hypothetical protein
MQQDVRDKNILKRFADVECNNMKLQGLYIVFCFHNTCVLYDRSWLRTNIGRPSSVITEVEIYYMQTYSDPGEAVYATRKANIAPEGRLHQLSYFEV